MLLLNGENKDRIKYIYYQKNRNNVENYNVSCYNNIMVSKGKIIKDCKSEL